MLPVPLRIMLQELVYNVHVVHVDVFRATLNGSTRLQCSDVDAGLGSHHPRRPVEITKLGANLARINISVPSAPPLPKSIYSR
jgi:hypothetical protein